MTKRREDGVHVVLKQSAPAYGLKNVEVPVLVVLCAMEFHVTHCYSQVCICSSSELHKSFLLWKDWCKSLKTMKACLHINYKLGVVF